MSKKNDLISYNDRKFWPLSPARHPRPSNPDSGGKVAFKYYHDHNKELIEFLQAAVLINDHEISDKKNQRRTWRSVADYNALVARDSASCLRFCN